MKLLPTQQRVEARDPRGSSVGLGIEAAAILALFFFAGFGLDRLLSTTPAFMIVLTLLGAIGLFARFKYQYDEQMTELEAERDARAAARRARPAVSEPGAVGSPDRGHGSR